jgi:hypothetical protein
MTTTVDADQLALDLGSYVAPQPTRKGATIQERFDAFNAANPWVLRAMESVTRQWLAAGHTKFGTKGLAEILRWEYGRRTTGEPFKISNDFTSRYARLLIARNPDWKDVFDLRPLKAD